METVIEKFMDALGITYEINLTRRGIHRGKSFVCYVIYAHYKGKKEYEQHHCYTLKRNDTVVYEEGNEVKGPDDGIFAYLAIDRDIDRYFENKTRQFAEEHFSTNPF